MKEELKLIMVVEDDPDIQEIIELSLCSVGGFSVILCRSGEEALKQLAQITPQLILLDVMMPKMDGPSLLMQIRAMPKVNAIPVIFMTAKVQPSEVKSYIQMGVCDVISKPFDPMSLPATILKIWERTTNEAACYSKAKK